MGQAGKPITASSAQNTFKTLQRFDLPSHPHRPLYLWLRLIMHRTIGLTDE